MQYTICAALILFSWMACSQEPATTPDPASAPPPVSEPAPVTEPTSAPATDAATVPTTEPNTVPTAEPNTLPATGSDIAPDPVSEEARLNDLLSLVKDNTLQIHKRENPAYFGLLKKILDRSVEQLNNEVAANPRFNDLYSNPEKYRGQLVRLDLNVRRIISIPVKVSNVANLTEVYEVWGWTEEAKAHMYCCVVPELPPGFPKDGDHDKRVDLVGYFMKMQAYQPGNAEPNQRNLVAPLIMGRITDAGPIIKRANDPMGNWPLILIIGFGTIVMFRLMMHLRGMTRSAPTHRNYRRRSLEPIDPDTLADGLGETDRGLRIRNASEP